MYEFILTDNNYCDMIFKNERENLIYFNIDKYGKMSKENEFSFKII